MGTNVTFNGSTYTVPAVSDTSWGTNVTNYLIALATGSLQKTGGTFTLTADADFGATYGLKSTYYKSRASNPSSAGSVRLGNAESIGWRNAANGADLLLTSSASDRLTYGAVNVPTISSTDTLTNKTISLTSNTLTGTSLELKTAISDETGSGALVFATTPTLVTPVIGAATGTSLALTGAMSALAGVSSPWTTGKVYAAGALALSGNYVILCLTGHTASAALATDVALGYWQMASPMKNYIMNSNMVIDQRNASAVVSAANTDNKFLVDRWQFSNSPTGKFNSGQNQGGLTPPSTFTKYFNLSCASTYTPGPGEYALFMQQNEGLNVAQLGFGKASAKTVTLSFWIYSTKTGTFGGSLANHNGTRSYPFTYVVNAISTWEQKFVVIAGDTTGTWVTDSAVGFKMFFDLGTGTTYKAAAGSWAAGNYVSATGASNWCTSGDGFNITGVMLNEGPAPASFQTAGDSYQAELEICMRYYQKTFSQAIAPAQNANPSGAGSLWATSNGTGAGAITISWRFNPVMRTAPTITLYSPDAATSNWSGTGTPTSTASEISDSGCRVRNSGASTDQVSYLIEAVASAEL